MTDLKTICKQVIESADRAAKRPWHMLCVFGSKDLPIAIAHGDESKTVLEWTDESTSSVSDVRYLLEAANNADRLAEACLIMQEALEFYTEKSVFEQGHGLGFHEDAAEALANVEELFK